MSVKATTYSESVRVIEIASALVIGALAIILVLRSRSGEQDLARQRRTMWNLERSAELARQGISEGAIKIPPETKRDLGPLLTQLRGDAGLGQDAWGHRISIEVQASLGGHKFSYCVESPGKDNAWTVNPRLGAFAFGDYASDLIYCDGRWVAYPQGPRH